ncbi:hypothetical protein KP509_02G101900 [Ceratopteris richardii]|uniref:Uncharacterized protein n=1 Tax=Ceratopteris richardii TaxID=49495 RepID=A0A8T2VGL2_CERRI|nr:hypothetical protein KP509_02G101900 [Ceratopteris richardii]
MSPFLLTCVSARLPTLPLRCAPSFVFMDLHHPLHTHVAAPHLPHFPIMLTGPPPPHLHPHTPPAPPPPISILIPILPLHHLHIHILIPILLPLLLTFMILLHPFLLTFMILLRSLTMILLHRLTTSPLPCIGLLMIFQILMMNQSDALLLHNMNT